MTPAIRMAQDLRRDDLQAQLWQLPASAARQARNLLAEFDQAGTAEDRGAVLRQLDELIYHARPRGAA